MLFVLLLVLRLCGRGGNRRWEKAISSLSAVRGGICVWDLQDGGFITELGLSSKQAWRILCLEREKEHSCPDYHVDMFFLLWPFWKCLLHSLDVIQPQSPLSVSFEPWLWIDTLWCPWLCKHRLTETSFRSCLFWLVRWYTEGPSEVFASVCFILRVCHTTASCLLKVLSSVKWDLVTLQYQWIFQWTFWNARNRCLKRSFLIRNTCSFLLHE